MDPDPGHDNQLLTYLILIIFAYFYAKLDEPFRDHEIFTAVQIFKVKCFSPVDPHIFTTKIFIYISVFKLHTYYTSDDKTTASE